MARDFCEMTLGSPATSDSKFVVYPNIEVWVYPRGATTLANYRTEVTLMAVIYQRETGVAEGPSPEAGATGTNPFITGDSGSVQFWAENAPYDLFIHDLNSPVRTDDRLIPWEASPSGQRVPVGPETNLKMIRGVVTWDGSNITPTEGIGYTVSRTTTGSYVVEFIVPFSDRPTVVVGSTSNFSIAQAIPTSTPNASVSVITRRPSESAATSDESFAFIAIGPA